jgi:8-oxo-dGTP diphosphatase
MIKINIKTNIKGAAVLVRNTCGDVLLLKRAPESRFAPDKWGYPGGKIEKGETPEEAVIRETQEETQLQLQTITPLGVVNGVVEAFYSNDFAGNVEIDFEHTDWKWVPPSELTTYDLAPSALDIYEEARKLHE